jgi:hypothetical protein
MRKFYIMVFILSLGIFSCNAQILRKNTPHKAEKELFGKSRGNKKEAKVREPRAVLKAKKKQEDNKKKQDEDYKKSVERSKKRTFEIQTSEVQKRMKQDKKDTARRDRLKRKKVKTSTVKAGKKYN